MKATTLNSGVRKHWVNLILNEDLLVQVHGLTNNLSGVVDSPPAEYDEPILIKIRSQKLIDLF